MRILIINNLQSGLRDGSIFDFMRKLARDGDELIMRCTDGNTPADSLLDDAKGCDLVVAAGGDGTIAAVCYALRFSGIPILPFPAGTGNLLAVNLNLPEEPYALAEMARECQAIDFDLVEMDFDADGQTMTKGLIIIGGAGYDATIMKSSGHLKQTLGPGAYFAAAIGNPNPAIARFTIHLDDQVVEAEGIAALVLNFAKIHPDISITHANDARDGQLEIAVIKPHHTMELLPAIFAAFLDRDGGYPHRASAVETFKTKRVRVESTPPMPLQYDGEAHGYQTPFEARILPLATRLVVTKQEIQRLSAKQAFSYPTDRA
jgi:diacylglycerol kinase family enzyme